MTSMAGPLTSENVVGGLCCVSGCIRPDPALVGRLCPIRAQVLEVLLRLQLFPDHATARVRLLRVVNSASRAGRGHRAGVSTTATCDAQATGCACGPKNVTSGAYPELQSTEEGWLMLLNEMNAVVAEELRGTPRGPRGSAQNQFRAAYQYFRLNSLGRRPVVHSSPQLAKRPSVRSAYNEAYSATA